MENYTDISKKYLAKNRKRSLYTILGCALVAAVLFAILNSFNNWWISWREAIREDADWEILVYNNDKDIAESVVNEDFVRSAMMGSAYSEEGYYKNEDVTVNSVYLNVKNIYKVKKYGEYLRDKYSVRIDYNEELLDTYLINRSGSAWIAFIICIFISYIFAIIGIGIIRNAVSISAIERLKDYGEMRCIGATKRQIRAIVFRESIIQEGIGVAAGITAGYLISLIFCIRYMLPLGFHILPAVMVAVCFLFDLYFVINENTKKITSVQPVDAVRGNYRIRLGKTKHTGRSIWGLIFGVEGAYAYKNVKRNRLRFIKSVAAIAFGIATVVLIGGIIGYLLEYVRLSDERYGYYQEYREGAVYPFYTKDEVRATLWSPDQVRALKNIRGVEDLSYVYKTILYTQGNNDIYDKITEEYRYFDYRQDVLGEHLEAEFENLTPYAELSDEEKQYFDSEENYKASMIKRKELREEHTRAFAEDIDRCYDKEGQLLDYDELCFPGGEGRYISYVPAQLTESASFSLYGYEGEDWERYRDHLVEGTLDISDHGIVLINGGYAYNLDFLWSLDAIRFAPTKYVYTDYKVGDEVTFVDPAELYNLVQSEMKRATEYDKVHVAENVKWHEEHDGEWAENHPEEYKAHVDYEELTTTENGRGWIVEAAREKLISEGHCKTYIIEGIVDQDVNHCNEGPVFIMPLDKYFAATGSTAEDFTGFQYHIGNVFYNDLSSEKYSEIMNDDELYDKYEEHDEITGRVYYRDPQIFPLYSKYITTTMTIDFFKPVVYAGVVILIIVLVNCLNIFNVTMSNIALRRNEFAQLRAIGMTKRSLFKGVILEGVIMWITACILGMSAGIAIEYFIYKYILQYLVYAEFSIFWPVIAVALVLSFIVLVGAYYFPMKRMKLDVAEELMRSGE